MSLAASLLLAALAQPQATRFDLGERLKLMEEAWREAPAASRRAAVPAISRSVAAFFTQQTGAAAKGLDEAVASLEGRSPRPEDALTIRFIPPYVSPAGKARASITWAYPVESTKPVEVTVGSAKVKVTPGTNAFLEVSAESVSPAGDSEQEVGVLVSVQAGESARGAYLTLVDNLPSRVDALAKSEDPRVKALASLLTRLMSSQSEQDMPILESLNLAEKLQAKAVSPTDVRHWPIAQEGSTLLRASIPAELPEKPVLVIALHGAGGSENLFFDGYGRGQAVGLAQKRGWALVAPRASATGAADALAWFTKTTGKTPGRIVIMGHSMGGAMALMTGRLPIKPSAVVLFAPASGRVPAELEGVPMFLSVGKQEMMMLAGSAQQLQRQLEGKPHFKYKVVDPCEHLMIVADALPAAYEWLDSLP